METGLEKLLKKMLVKERYIANRIKLLKILF